MSREACTQSNASVSRRILFDERIVMVGCDKTLPAAAMELARLVIPGIVLNGGSIAPGHVGGRDVTIQDVFEAIGAHASGKLSDAGLCGMEDRACPGAGACGGQFTANTLAPAPQVLGLAAFGSGAGPGARPPTPD